MILSGAITLLGAGIFLYSIKKIFWDRGKKRKLIMWIFVAILSCIVTLPAYVITDLLNHSNPHRLHEIILPLDGHVQGDTETVEFLLPKGKYIIILAFKSEDGNDTEIKVHYKISLENYGIVAEEEKEIKMEFISYHSKSFVIDKDKTKGEFTATIIEPSPLTTQVKVVLSTHIFH